jgi:hypothetical protein
VACQKGEQGLLQFLPDPAGATRIAFATVSLPLLTSAGLCLIPGIAALAIRTLFGGVPAIDVARATIVILAFATWAFALGFYCSVRCRDAFAAAGCALLVILVVLAQPIWFGPVISSTGEASLMIQASLLINPAVGVASAIDFDLFRTEPLYQVCPIGQRPFEYPSCWAVASLYLCLSAVLIWRSVSGFRRMAEPAIS